MSRSRAPAADRNSLDHKQDAPSIAEGAFILGQPSVARPQAHWFTSHPAPSILAKEQNWRGGQRVGRKVAFGVPGRLAADIIEAVRRLAEPQPDGPPELSAHVVADVRLSDLAETLLEFLAYKSPATAAHSRRVSTLAVHLGSSQALNAAELEVLSAAALLHDVGKLAMPAHLLEKPGQLTGHEARIMRGHTEIGERLFHGTPVLDRIGRIVGEHHEKRDGSGYPKGLTVAEQDPLTAIVTVADVYDALTGRRAYKGEMSGQEARALMRRDMSAALAPDVLTALDRLAAE